MTQWNKFLLERDELEANPENTGLMQFIADKSADGRMPHELAGPILDEWLPNILERVYGTGYEDGSQEGYDAGFDDGLFEAGEQE